MAENRIGNPRSEETTIVGAKYDAFLFHLDGVVSQSMRLQASAWKMLFDDYLRERALKSGEPFAPFDMEADYVYVRRRQAPLRWGAQFPRNARI